MQAQEGSWTRNENWSLSLQSSPETQKILRMAGAGRSLAEVWGKAWLRKRTCPAYREIKALASWLKRRFKMVLSFHKSFIPNVRVNKLPDLWCSTLFIWTCWDHQPIESVWLEIWRHISLGWITNPHTLPQRCSFLLCCTLPKGKGLHKPKTGCPEMLSTELRQNSYSVPLCILTDSESFMWI